MKQTVSVLELGAVHVGLLESALKGRDYKEQIEYREIADTIPTRYYLDVVAIYLEKAFAEGDCSHNFVDVLAKSIINTFKNCADLSGNEKKILDRLFDLDFDIDTQPLRGDFKVVVQNVIDLYQFKIDTSVFMQLKAVGVLLLSKDIVSRLRFSIRDESRKSEAFFSIFKRESYIIAKLLKEKPQEEPSVDQDIDKAKQYKKPELAEAHVVLTRALDFVENYTVIDGRVRLFSNGRELQENRLAVLLNDALCSLIYSSQTKKTEDLINHVHSFMPMTLSKNEQQVLSSLFNVLHTNKEIFYK